MITIKIEVGLLIETSGTMATKLSKDELLAKWTTLIKQFRDGEPGCRYSCVNVKGNETKDTYAEAILLLRDEQSV